MIGSLYGFRWRYCCFKKMPFWGGSLQRGRRGGLVHVLYSNTLLWPWLDTAKMEISICHYKRNSEMGHGLFLSPWCLIASPFPDGHSTTPSWNTLLFICIANASTRNNTCTQTNTKRKVILSNGKWAKKNMSCLSHSMQMNCTEILLTFFKLTIHVKHTANYIPYT